MSTATAEPPKAKAPESDELTDLQRAAVQLSHLNDLTMAGHAAEKLALGRKRLAKTWRDGDQLEDGDVAGGADDMQQILARDVSFISNHPAPTMPPAADKPVEATVPAKGRAWPLWAATLLGLSIPGTAGIFMAPWIIEALYPPQTPAPVVVPAGPTEYVPILLPGKPGTVKE